MTLIEKSLKIALQAHLGQTDKSGRPYILHSWRIMTKLLLSGLFLGILTLSGSTFASDDSPLPDVVKTPSPVNPIPIPYPNIGKVSAKPDSKSKGNSKRVDRDFDRR